MDGLDVKRGHVDDLEVENGTSGGLNAKSTQGHALDFWRGQVADLDN